LGNRVCDWVRVVRSEAGITRCLDAKRWFVMLSPSGSEYTPIFEGVQ
jgi:hypothetical protein